MFLLIIIFRPKKANDDIKQNDDNYNQGDEISLYDVDYVAEKVFDKAKEQIRNHLYPFGFSEGNSGVDYLLSRSNASKALRSKRQQVQLL